MATSQNGWPASPDLPLRALRVGGAEFVPGVLDHNDVATVLGYVAREFHQRVESLVAGWCWGFNYRPNRNDPNALSNHSSATAIDCNAPRHPNGVPASETFTPVQIAIVHQILAEVDHVVRWGGDYRTTPDAMHFEINADAAAVARVADKLREDEVTPEQEDRIADKVAKAVFAELQTVTKPSGEERELTFRQQVREIWQKLARS